MAGPTLVTNRSAPLLASVRPLVAWPDPKAMPQFYDVADEIAMAFKSYGVTKNFMLGGLARAELESSLRLVVVGDKDAAQGPAHGLWQWDLARCAEIHQHLDIDIINGASVEDQVKSVMWELETFPYYGLKQIQAAPDPNTSGMMWCEFYDRPERADEPTRTGMAAVRWATQWTFPGW